MSFLSGLFNNAPTPDLKSLIEGGAFLVDVRTPGEFAEGHVNGSENIPLDMVPANLDRFRGKQNIVVFCRSGNRSGQAKAILESSGIVNVVNGGTWQDVNQFIK
jgi:rhodanese-related sulfurtransferase